MTAATRAGTVRRVGRWRGPVVLMGPGLAFYALLVAAPVLLVLAYTVTTRGRFGGVEWTFTLDNFRRAADPLYLDVLWSSLGIAALATVLALLLGYPTAYAISRLPPRWRTAALVLVVVPFWTNFLIRMYAWIVLLNSQGVVSDALLALGITDAPVGLLYNDGAVVVGLVYVYLPLMVLPVYAAVERLDPELVEASANLGAGRLRTFWSVQLPLTLPGVLTGSILVFVPSLGNFVVPELLGGGKTVMVGNLVRDQFLKVQDWPFGSVLAFVVVVAMVTLFAAQGGLGWLWVPLVLCAAFLYVPIGVLVAMSFNDGGSAFSWDGFSLRWYDELLHDTRLHDAVLTSLGVALGATVIATVLGTLLAVGLARHNRSRLLEAAAMAPAVLPDLLLAIGLLAFFYAASVPKSAATVLLAHAAFGTAFVVAVVRARLAGLDTAQEEASRDIGAGAVTTFLRITLPAVRPAVVAGALLVFTLSLDEFVIAFFTAGPTTQTLPIAVYSMVRVGVTPEVNALATVLVAVSVVVVVVAARTVRRDPR